MKPTRRPGIAKVLLTGGPRADKETGRHIRHAGMGILLDSRRLLTCAHVVNTAIGQPQTAIQQPAADVPISIDFPLSQHRAPLKAHVDRWFPPTADPISDIAVLTLKADLPRDVGYVTFQSTSDGSSRAELSVFGCAADSDIPGNVALKMMGPVSPGQIQIDGASHTGVFVEGGYSGAAVCDLTSGRVVGMVNALNSRIADRVAYMIPTAQLLNAIPDLPLGESGLKGFFRDYIADKTAGFVGREHVFAAIQEFLANADCGYLTLLGDPGIGKSSIFCSLTQRMQCGASFFFIRSDGITRADQFYSHLAEELKLRSEYAATAPGDANPTVLREWLASAAQSLRGERLVLVVDALDECDEVTRRNSVFNLLHMPRSLPENVFLLLSRRKLHEQEYNIRLETDARTRNEEFDLMGHPAQNRADVTLYLQNYFAAHLGPHPWLQKHGRSTEEGVSALLDSSECNFVYLHHVLPHIAEHPEEFTPTTLPKGLREYYIGHWKRMTAAGMDSPSVRRALRVIYVLAAARKSVSQQTLTDSLPDLEPNALQGAIDQWQEFLHIENGSEGPTYRIYHDSFAGFLTDRDPDRKHMRTASATLRDWFIRKLKTSSQP